MTGKWVAIASFKCVVEMGTIVLSSHSLHCLPPVEYHLTGQGVGGTVALAHCRGVCYGMSCMEAICVAEGRSRLHVMMRE